MKSNDPWAPNSIPASDPWSSGAARPKTSNTGSFDLFNASNGDGVEYPKDPSPSCPNHLVNLDSVTQTSPARARSSTALASTGGSARRCPSTLSKSAAAPTPQPDAVSPMPWLQALSPWPMSSPHPRQLITMVPWPGWPHGSQVMPGMGVGPEVWGRALGSRPMSMPQPLMSMLGTQPTEPPTFLLGG
ncbi:epsin-2 isoform X2, partial [Lates japonicus]